jgi:hypothetical protein
LYSPQKSRKAHNTIQRRKARKKAKKWDAQHERLSARQFFKHDTNTKIVKGSEKFKARTIAYLQLKGQTRETSALNVLAAAKDNAKDFARILNDNTDTDVVAYMKALKKDDREKVLAAGRMGLASGESSELAEWETVHGSPMTYSLPLSR